MPAFDWAEETEEHRRLRAAFLDGMIRIEHELDELMLDVFEVPVEDGRAHLFEAVLLPTVEMRTKLELVGHVIAFAKLEQRFSSVLSQLKQGNALRNDIAHRTVWMRRTIKSPEMHLVFKGFRNGKEKVTTMSPATLKKKVDALEGTWLDVLRLRIALAAKLGYSPPSLPPTLQRMVDEAN